MDLLRDKQARALAEFKRLMATQIKVDIASAIRQHPHLHGDSATHAYNTLASDNSVNELVTELARDEVEDALARGEVPAAAFLHLAGYPTNDVAES